MGKQERRTGETGLVSVLDFQILDALCALRGATTNVARARLCDLHRSTYLRLRNGRTPSLDTAFDLAERFGVTVDQIIRRRQRTPKERAA